MKLPTRFMFLTNELPRLKDSSTALAGRFLVLSMQQSFYSQEDLTLTARLCGELPGILNWALDGWSRLQGHGCFTQPRSVEDAIEQLEELASPVRSFVRECCVIGYDHRVPIRHLYAAWHMWCQQNGRPPGTVQLFGRDLGAAVPTIKRRRSDAHGAANGAFYEGIAISSETAAAVAAFQPEQRATVAALSR
jgi:putative DNA primase/helicase